MKRLNTREVYNVDTNYVFSEEICISVNKPIVIEVEEKIIKVAEKVKNTFSNLIKNTVKENKIDSVFSKSKSKDQFHKTGTENIEYNKITKKVNINGQNFVISGYSQEEISNRINSLNSKDLNQTKELENPLLFPSLYTEQKKLETNEWVQKRDVWSEQYIYA
ncbi:MAG: hypothetical protein ACK4IX_02355 [Candidatus Sericytochromatia bacterium]